MDTSPEIGIELASYEFAADAGKAREFALALFTRDPDWRSAPRDHLHGKVVPPTFTTVSSFQWDRSILARDQLCLDLARTLHLSTTWEYERPIVVGDVLAGEMRLTGRTAKPSRRAGAIRLFELTCVFRDAAGRLVATECFTFAELARLPSRESASTDRALGDSPNGSATAHEREVGPISRTDIVRYAGAGGDFSPIHHDESVAVAAGNPSVFAMGLLQGGILAQHAAESRRDQELRRLSLRFEDRVWPGDVLKLSSTSHPLSPDVAIEARTGSGAVAVSGRMRFAHRNSPSYDAGQGAEPEWT